MKKPELVFIPLAASSHLTASIQFAKRLLDQYENLSITVLIIHIPPKTDLDPYTKSIVSSNDKIRFIIIPPANIINNRFSQSNSSSISIEMFANILFESHKPQVERAIMEMVSNDAIVGFVLDMFSSCMIDVANKFKVPSYIFCPFSTAFLGFLLHLPTRHNQVGASFDPSDPDSVIPSYQNNVPANVLPGAVFDKSGGGYESHLYQGTRFKECKGFIVNSFVELEPHAVNSIVTPPNVYPVGPLVDFKNHNDSSGSIGIRNWLDKQPLKSVLFLCFGTMGYFNESQLEQMAIALERSGHRFLWSVRQPPPKDTHGATSDYENIEKVLPDGFIERVKERGMVCGWAPQAEVLAHGAVKGFVSHCGWNSILESLWYNVPIATWPLIAEQQLNAFLMVRELELAVELSLSYRSSGSELVLADQIERAIHSLMDDANPVREKVKDISEKGRNAMIKGGSSSVTLEKFVQDMLQDIGE